LSYREDEFPIVNGSSGQTVGPFGTKNGRLLEKRFENRIVLYREVWHAELGNHLLVAGYKASEFYPFGNIRAVRVSLIEDSREQDRISVMVREGRSMHVIFYNGKGLPNEESGG
jgi:hypothetical protein